MRRLLAAAIVVGFALPAQAQYVETVVRTIATQQRDGVVTSPSYTVPADATGGLRLRLNIPTSDYENVANSCTLTLYRLEGGVWRVSGRTTWQGGHVDFFDEDTGLIVVNPAPFVGTELTSVRGMDIRAELEVPTRMRIGASVILLTPTP